MNIREVAIQTKMSELAVRTAIRKGKLITTRIPRNETQFSYEINEKAVTDWRANAGAHNSRDDGRRKLILYADAIELPKIKKLLKDNGLGPVADLIRIANKTSK